MEQKSGATQSAWLQSAEFGFSDDRLSDNLDICIIGAGIVGLSCAYMLCREGRTVTVLDAGRVAGGDTSRTTAHLSSALDEGFVEIIRIHGKARANLAYESHNGAINIIEEIVKSEAVECEFQRVDGYLFEGDNSTLSLQEEYQASLDSGFEDVEYPVDPPTASLSDKPCLRFPRQAQFDPIKYMAGLVKAVRDNGGKIVCGQFVKVVEEKNGEGIITMEDDSVISASEVIVATNGPIVSLTMQLKQAPYRTYAIGVEVPGGSVPVALYWDTEDPYHYVRLMHGGSGESDYLIVGGEDHKVGQDHTPGHRFDCLYEWAKERFDGLGEIKYRWSGQVMEPADGLAFIGRAPGKKHIYVCSGDSGMGMTHGTIAGGVITDLIQGRENRFSELYDPGRVLVKSIPTMVKEGATAVKQLGARVGPGEVKSIEDIPAGSGAVIREGMSKIACHRSDDGKVTKVTAVCSHLGCEVEWNDLEKSWDCPCHGSRFRPGGEVIAGPATYPLKSS